MESGLKKLKLEIEKHKKPSDRGDKFAERMEVLIATCEKIIIVILH